MNDKEKLILYACFMLLIFTLYSIRYFDIRYNHIDKIKTELFTINNKFFYLWFTYLFVNLLIKINLGDKYSKEIKIINLLVVGCFMLMDIGNIAENIKYFYRFITTR